VVTQAAQWLEVRARLHEDGIPGIYQEAPGTPGSASGVAAGPSRATAGASPSRRWFPSACTGCGADGSRLGRSPCWRATRAWASRCSRLIWSRGWPPGGSCPLRPRRSRRPRRTNRRSLAALPSRADWQQPCGAAIL